MLINLSQDDDVNLPVKPLIFALAMGACLGGELLYLPSILRRIVENRTKKETLKDQNRHPKIIDGVETKNFWCYVTIHLITLSINRYNLL